MPEHLYYDRTQDAVWYYMDNGKPGFYGWLEDLTKEEFSKLEYLICPDEED